VSVDLAVIRFGGQGAAAEAYAAARDRATGRYSSSSPPRWTEDVGLVERHHNGRLLLRGMFAGHYLDVDEDDDVSQEGAGEGAASGGIVGALLGPPGIAVGLLVGMLIGARVGSSKEREDEPQALAAKLRDAVPRSSSAIVMFAQAPEIDELLAALGESPDEVIRRTLSDDEAAALETSLSSTPSRP
jgi:uncharacterized membrane protein